MKLINENLSYHFPAKKNPGVEPATNNDHTSSMVQCMTAKIICCRALLSRIADHLGEKTLLEEVSLPLKQWIGISGVLRVARVYFSMLALKQTL